MEDDLDGFEVFKATKKPRKLKPNEVSLTDANMVISEHLAGQFLPGESGRVTLMFNPAWRIIGVRAAKSDEHSYKVSYRSISSRAFYARFKIHERGRFRATIKNGILMVNLKEPS